ncbi:hypothetical protein SNE25_26160 [Mucilaginibacter sabulilitoris]|uniref:Transcriptional regulator, AbiEi antitoxin, Type IV TA system n=1 Tax=Mucilaginibacter sabulilitoris TaxID=1173583 RepID=A0ABZ0TKU6_9SPHI|nr:hypothetical protein [Mucilaginibacter sabulilitoris]WPU92813.1 hypothetical protein SNE25_26160 [Mucilaginibacter sabulilitoris]
MNFDDALAAYAEEPLTRQVILPLLNGYKRPNDKIAELVKAGALATIKNGLYVPGPASKVSGPEPFLIANHLWGPSYISFETALSYWGFIPERVYEISSVTVKISKAYRTSAGRFTYRHAPLPYYSFGIKSTRLSSRQTVLIASPEKALFDKIAMTAGVHLRSVPQVLTLLIEDLRIEKDKLREIDTKMMNTWITDAPKRSSLNMLITTLNTL